MSSDSDLTWRNMRSIPYIPKNANLLYRNVANINQLSSDAQCWNFQPWVDENAMRF